MTRAFQGVPAVYYFKLDSLQAQLPALQQLPLVHHKAHIL